MGRDLKKTRRKRKKRDPVQCVYKQVPLRFNPAEGLRDHLDCASDSEYLSANSHPSFLKSSSQGKLADISGLPWVYCKYSGGQRKPQRKEGQVRAVQSSLAGVCGDEGSGPDVNNACHMDRLLVLDCGEGNSLHVNKKL